MAATEAAEGTSENNSDQHFKLWKQEEGEGKATKMKRVKIYTLLDPLSHSPSHSLFQRGIPQH